MIRACLALLAVSTVLRAEPLFVDVTARSGIAFEHVCGSRDKDWIVEVNGSGVALFDFDGDGDLDIYFVNGSRFGDAEKPEAARPRNALYRNDGGWRFTDVTSSAGVGDTGWGSGVAVADVDNDGALDLYVTNFGPNALYRNRGDGSFERVERSGAEDAAWGASASFADFDRDGLVDLYVANYVEFDRQSVKPRASGRCVYKGAPIFCGPGGLEPAPDVLLLNRGGAHFKDVSESWGLRRGKPGYGLGTLVVDVQRDGFPDVIVANDTSPNFCLVSSGGGGFQDAALFLGLAYNDYGVAQAGMGLASGDTRGLGRDDILVTNFEDDTNTLYRADESGHLFVESTYAAGLGTASFPYLAWGTFFIDGDGDGDLDLFVANGHVAPQMRSVRSSGGYEQRNQLFRNDGKGRFALVEPAAGSGLLVKRSSRGAAAGDLDGDGDPDIVVSNIDGAPTILENRSSHRDWLVVTLRGSKSNRAAIGARVTLSSTGGRRQEHTVQSGMSFASQCELAARFAVDDREALERLVVEWPSGARSEFKGEALRRARMIRAVED